MAGAHMEEYGAVLDLVSWISLVKGTISEDWLSVIESDEDLRSNLDEILQDLHQRYQPRPNGIWAANPNWLEMFSWTSCPLSNVRAVILLKGPNVGQPGRMSDFESTGYGTGVRRRSNNNNNWQHISTIPTVWNTFLLSLLASENPDLGMRDFLRAAYANGFNPEVLSRNGILFLNVALTLGHDGNNFPGNTEVWRWQPFTLDILRAIPGNQIPIFQWYISRGIEFALGNAEGHARFLVSRPNRLRMEDDAHQHICGFDETMIMEYAEELRDIQYEQHINILREMFRTIVDQHGEMTYPSPPAHQ